MPDTWSNPCSVRNRRLAFEHAAAVVERAVERFGPFAGATADALAADVVSRVHERMRIVPTALGLGVPRILDEALQRRGGNCSTFAAVLTVLLRAQGIPARLVVEDVFTDLSLLRAPAALLRAPVGPTLNGHVWVEALVQGAWLPADAELGLFGLGGWLTARVLRGVSLSALGLPARERWRFPLRLLARRGLLGGLPCRRPGDASAAAVAARLE